MSEASAADSVRVETTEDSPVVRTVAVEVPKARVSAAFEKAYKSLGRTARVKGFRPGKVPRSVLQKVYGPAAAEEVERLLVGESIQDALELAEVEAVTEPDIDAQLPKEGTPFCYSARVEVKPAIELPELEGLAAKQPSVAVSDADVDERLEGIRERVAPLVEVEEGAGAELGHTLNIDFEGRVDGELFDGGAGEDMVIELGSGRLIPGFEEQLVGAHAGEDRTLDVTFPDDYGEESLRGKQATFAAKVRSIRHKQLPALDDEFAKDVGEESIEKMRTKLREQMVESAQQQAKSVLHRTVMDSLLEQCSFDAPPGLVERQLHSQMRSMEQQFEGRVSSEVLRGELARMHEDGRESAERRVREGLVLEVVASGAGLSVDPAEIDARLNEIAEAQGADPRQIREMAEQQGWQASIEAELLDAKALDFLATKANVEDTTDT